MMTQEQIADIKALEKRIKDQGYSSICFLLVAYSIGGGTRYFIDLATAIAKYTTLTVYYADYEGGYAYDYFERNPMLNVHNLKFNIYDKVWPIDDPMIIVTSSTKIVQIKKMNKQNKVVLWHFETVPCAWDWLMFNKEEKKFIKIANLTNSLCYHDWSARDILSWQFNESLDKKKYLQVYCLQDEKNEPIFKESLVNDKEINVVWVGRLVLDKINSLYNIIDNYAKYKTSRIKRLHIIGDGLKREELLKYVKRYTNCIQFIFKGVVPYDELRNYLVKNCDIAFSMGTSIIDCAAYGLPSAVVFLSNKRFNENEYYWIYNAKEYCVGINVEQKDRFGVSYCSLENMIDSIISKEGMTSISQKCYDYYQKNHSNFGEIVIKVLQYAIETEFTYDKILKLLKFTPYNIIEQYDLRINNLLIKKTVKFGEYVYFYLGKWLVCNKLLDDQNRFIRFGFFRCKPNIKLTGNKRWNSIDKNSQNVKFRMGKLTITKCFHIGWKFPGSLFRENKSEKAGE